MISFCAICKTYPIRLHGEPMISFACRGAQASFSLARNLRQVLAQVAPSLLCTRYFPTEALVNASTTFHDTPPLVINVGVHLVIANCDYSSRLCGDAGAFFREIVGARDACSWALQCDFLCTKVAGIYTNILGLSLLYGFPIGKLETICAKGPRSVNGSNEKNDVHLAVNV